MKTKFHEGIMDLFTWDKLVWSYTKRDLSDSNDKLLAISGIASRLAEKSQDAYTAGMWHFHLTRGLLWEVGSRLEPRPVPYRAPTWAWASVNGSISHGMGMVTMTDPDFRILSIDSDLTESSALYGNVRYASITVRGWMRKLYWTDSSSNLLEAGQLESVEDGGIDTLAETMPDVSDDENHDMLPVWCLQISIHNLNDGPYGLILTEEDGNVFKRRGVFGFSSLKDERWRATLRDARRERMRSWKGFCDLQTIVTV
ncbi:Nn.00g070880.m01.CDS01 [Neocucurbitaria sp. VM-36]